MWSTRVAVIGDVQGMEVAEKERLTVGVGECSLDQRKLLNRSEA